MPECERCKDTRWVLPEPIGVFLIDLSEIPCPECNVPETCEQLLRRFAEPEPWMDDDYGNTKSCFFCGSLLDEKTHSTDCIYIRARKYLNVT